jgi:ABC-type branched-subunit amino acid transport system ATPase component
VATFDTSTNVSDTLTLDGATVDYGGVRALRGVSLSVTPGRVLGLIGPNGAGKTSLINATTGIVALSSGTIRLGERFLNGRAQHEIARAGIARTYQNIRLFGALDVQSNLAAGAYTRPGRLSPARAKALLERAGIAHIELDTIASALPYGDQRRLEIARALAAEPQIIMLDEPAAGMNPPETARLVDTIASIASTGIGVLLIEHDMTLVRAACHDVVVLNFGEVIARGTPEEIGANPTVVEAYLGTDEGAA